MIVIHTENIRNLFQEYRSQYPEQAKQNPRPTVEKLRSGWYAILESRADKGIMAQIRTTKERRIEYGI